jgi:predicted ester cyclase
MKVPDDPSELIRSLFQDDKGLLRDDFIKRLNPEARWRADVFEKGEVDASGAAAFVDELRTAFPDLKIEVSNTYPGSNPGEVAFEFRISGTNDGYLAGVGTTGKSVSVDAFGVASFGDDSLLQEMRTAWNMQAFLAELGVRAHMRPDPV